MIERASGSLQLVDNAERTSARAHRGARRPLARVARLLARRPATPTCSGATAGSPRSSSRRRRRRRTRRAGGQLDRRRDLARRAHRRGRELRARRREALRRRDARAPEPRSRRPTAARASARRWSGIADAPGGRFVFSLFEAGEIWIVDVADPRRPRVRQVRERGQASRTTRSSPPTAASTSPGCSARTASRCSTCELRGRGVKRILAATAAGRRSCPSTRCRTCAAGRWPGGYAFLPAIGRHEVLVVDTRELARGRARSRSHGQPVFVMARPDGAAGVGQLRVPATTTRCR